MAHTLPTLPYAFNALEPAIDAMTMEIHSQRHHKAYVDNLNKALEGHADLLAHDIVSLLRNIKSVPETIRQAVINNGGGHHNHALFWEIMAPNAGGEPNGAIGEAITAAFGDFAKFKETFKQNGLTQFGSGWTWLVYDPAATAIKAIKKPNQDSPLMDGMVPLLGCDVWEHAYYLKYQNKRADYLEAWWTVVNWNKVNELFAAAKAGK
jgi:Fe-Mn family superoxide dismutase